MIPEVVQVREATTTAAESEDTSQRSGETTGARTRKGTENPAIATQKRKPTKCDDASATQEGGVESGGGEFDTGSGDDNSGGGGGGERRNCGATKGLKKKGNARWQGSAKERKRRLSKKLFVVSPTSQVHSGYWLVGRLCVPLFLSMPHPSVSRHLQLLRL